MCESGTPARTRGRGLVGIAAGGGSVASAVCAVFMHSWLPVIVGGSLCGLVVLLASLGMLIPICRGFYPNIENGQFKLKFEKVGVDHDSGKTRSRR